MLLVQRTPQIQIKPHKLWKLTISSLLSIVIAIVWLLLWPCSGFGEVINNRSDEKALTVICLHFQSSFFCSSSRNQINTCRMMILHNQFFSY
mmetsp:Transcript_25956/g.40292  ORF Transcript_25956/g.40292 Transcript_25956/m.40292 type:complete len:92 (-) Transcript_25956:139-414(-)